MHINRTRVLRDNRGFATVFTMGALAIIIMFAVGVSVINYAAQSSLVNETKAFTSAIESRASAYAEDLNTSLTAGDSAVGATTLWGDSRSNITTEITKVDKGTGTRALTIRASLTAGSKSLTRVVSVKSTRVTHIIGYDGTKPLWADSTADPHAFSLWALAAGSTRPLTPSELAGPSLAATTWLQATSRLGIDAKNHLWGWGSNEYAQSSGGATSMSVPTPVQISPTSTFRSVASDETSSYAIDTTGKLWAWGDNRNGKLGLGNSNWTPTPTRVGSLSYQAVVTGGGSSYALDSRGRIWAWGNNSVGQLALGSGAANVQTPVQFNAGAFYTTIATDGASSFAIDTAGVTWAWGSDSAGQLGIGWAGDRTSPGIVAGSHKFRSVSVAGQSVAAIATDGSLWSWGLGSRIGKAGSANSMVPVAIAPGQQFLQVSVGATTTYAIDPTGHLFAWGDNSRGQYGDTTKNTSPTPKAVLPVVRFSSVLANNSSMYSSAIDSDGGLWSFGHSGTGLWSLTFNTDSKSAMKMPAP